MLLQKVKNRWAMIDPIHRRETTKVKVKGAMWHKGCVGNLRQSRRRKSKVDTRHSKRLLDAKPNTAVELWRGRRKLDQNKGGMDNLVRRTWDRSNIHKELAWCAPSLRAHGRIAILSSSLGFATTLVVEDVFDLFEDQPGGFPMRSRTVNKPRLPCH